MLEGDFALCISLYHGYELLMQMGLRSLFFYIQGIMDGSRGRSPRFQAFSVFSSTLSTDTCAREHFFVSAPWVYSHSLMHNAKVFALFGSEMSRARNELQRTPAFMELYHEMEAMFVKPSAGN